MTPENTHQPSSILADEANSRSSSPAAGAPAELTSRAAVLRRARVDETMHDALQRWHDGQMSWERALNFLAVKQSEEYTRLREQSARAFATSAPGLMTAKESRLVRDLDADGGTEGEQS